MPSVARGCSPLYLPASRPGHLRPDRHQHQPPHRKRQRHQFAQHAAPTAGGPATLSSLSLFAFHNNLSRLGEGLQDATWPPHTNPRVERQQQLFERPQFERAAQNKPSAIRPSMRCEEPGQPPRPCPRLPPRGLGEHNSLSPQAGQPTCAHTHTQNAAIAVQLGELVSRSCHSPTSPRAPRAPPRVCMVCPGTSEGAGRPDNLPLRFEHILSRPLPHAEFGCAVASPNRLRTRSTNSLFMPNSCLNLRPGRSC